MEESKCPICLGSIEIDGSTLINCKNCVCIQLCFHYLGGHMYHFDCLQQLYENDYRRGIRSNCSICRKLITSPPVRIFNATCFPKEAIGYEILGPNVSGKKISNPTQRTTQSGSIDFYENRLAEMEMQLRNFRRLNEQVVTLEADLLGCQSQLQSTRRELDRRNLEMNAILSQQKHANDQIKNLQESLEESKRELESFKYLKAANEVSRLSKEISIFQYDSYFKNLKNDPETSKADLILQLAGMTANFRPIEGEKEETERQLRFLKISMEKAEREAAKREKNRDKVKVEIIKIDDSSDKDDNSETENNNVHSTHNTQSTAHQLQNPPQYTNPFLISKSSVPSVRPKSLKTFAGSAVSTGTGKKAKVIETPAGKRFIN